MAPPPPPTKKIKRAKIILDEDSYTNALSEIITRDFFPGLLERRLQQDYLDALESQNRSWIAKATRNLVESTPERKDICLAPKKEGHIKLESPAPSEIAASPVPSTPGYLVPSVEHMVKPRVNTNMSLTKFQNTYTSEDNESFYQLVDKQNEKRAQKKAWIYNGNKYDSKQLIAQRKVQQKLEASGTLKDDGYMEKDRLAIQDSDTRPAAPDTWKWKPKNTLMFQPEGVDPSPMEIASRPKGINYHNIRPPLSAEEIEAQKPRPSSPTMSAIRDALNGHPRREHMSASERGSVAGGDETPRVNGYAFVESDDEDDLPVIPRLDLGKGKETPSPFHIQHKGKKEQLLDRMVDRMNKSHQEASRNGFTGKVKQTPVPTIPYSPRVGTPGRLTPAAQRLLGQLGSNKTVKMQVGTAFGETDGSFAPKTPMTPRGSLLKRAKK